MKVFFQVDVAILIIMVTILLLSVIISSIGSKAKKMLPKIAYPLLFFLFALECSWSIAGIDLLNHYNEDRCK
jgi:hypothetical protein